MNKKLLYSITVIIVAFLSLGTAGYSFMVQQVENQSSDYKPAYLTIETDKEASLDGETKSHKNETVYVLVDHKGAVIEQSIVNRIYAQEDPKAALVIDYGQYESLENMTSPVQPLIENNKISWESQLLNEEDLYYEGKIDKQLPVDITITYYLDGREIEPAELAGQTGRLEIVLNFRNNLGYTEPYSYTGYEGNQVYVEEENYVPLLVQGSFDLDLNRYSEIDPGDGMNLVMGQSASINFMVFPYPEDEIKISMTGKDIELDRISLVIIPQLPGMPEVDLEDILIQILEGIQMFTDNFGDLTSGANQILSGLEQIRDEGTRLTGNTDEFYDLIKLYKNERDHLQTLFDQNNSDTLLDYFNALEELLALTDQVSDIQLDSDQIEQTMAEIDAASHLLAIADNRLAGLDSSSARVTAEAEKMISENEPGSALHELGLLLISRELELKKAADESALAIEKLSMVQSGLESFRLDWYEKYLPGLVSLTELAALIPAEGFDGQLAFLNNELATLVNNLEEVDRLILEADSLLESLDELPLVLNRLVEGQSQLSTGLEMLSSEGFATLEKELINGINESRAGKAKIGLMKKLADDYRSYADNEQNRFSEVRFIIQTPRLVVSRAGQSDNRQEEQINQHAWVERIWGKIIGLVE
jgi:putative membrane protein